jgi:hypothetical protein
MLASYAYALDNVDNRRVLTETLMAVLEAERVGQVISSPTHAWVTMTAQSGYTGTAYLHALPDLDALVQRSLWRPGLTHASLQYFPHHPLIKTKSTG